MLSAVAVLCSLGFRDFDRDLGSFIRGKEIAPVERRLNFLPAWSANAIEADRSATNTPYR